MPFVGNSTEVESEMREEVQEKLTDELPAALEFDPWDDRMLFGDDWVLHPLLDSAALH